VSVDNLELATSLLANYAVGVDITDDTNDGNIKINEITGVIRKEYFTKGKASNAMPTNVVSLLSEYGFVGSGSIKILRA
jgi:Ca2+-binding EF-hand superfamily protein